MDTPVDRLTRRNSVEKESKMLNVNQNGTNNSIELNLNDANIPVVFNQNGDGNRIIVNQSENSADRRVDFLKRALFAVMMCIVGEIVGSFELITALAEELAWAGLLLLLLA